MMNCSDQATLDEADWLAVHSETHDSFVHLCDGDNAQDTQMLAAWSSRRVEEELEQRIRKLCPSGLTTR